MVIKKSINQENDSNKKSKFDFSNKSDNVIIWENNLDKLKTYIDTNNKLPSTRNKCSEIRSLGKWYHDQKLKYKNKINIMKKLNLIFIGLTILIKLKNILKNTVKSLLEIVLILIFVN